MSKTEELTIADATVLTKCRTGGDIANKVLKVLVDGCVERASLRNLCIQGDKLIDEELSKVHKKDKDLSKGIAFPVCISVNNCINHFSPLDSEHDVTFQIGDMVKIDFALHIDGFPAVVAHTVVVGATAENKVSGRRADAILAAHYSAEAALRLFKPGNENVAVTNALNKVAETFSCVPIEGMLSFQLTQNCIDGEKMIHASSQRKDLDKSTINVHEVYGMDVMVSTGKGQSKEMDSKVTIYKKTDAAYSLKLKCSREFFRKVSKEHSVMPFNIRNFEDEKKARMGVLECVTHKLVTPYPVLWEKDGEFVAQFKFTVLVMPNGPQRVTGLPFDETLYNSKYSINDNKEALAMVQSSLNVRKKNKKKNTEKTEA